MKLLKTNIQTTIPPLLIFTALGFLVLVFLGIPCQGFAYPIEIKDGAGNQMVFKEKPMQIVSLVPSASEILFKIGAKDLVSGVTYHDATLEGAQDKEIVGGFFRPSLEKIGSLKPDLLIVSDLHKEIIQHYSGSACQVFVYKTDTIKGAYKNILTLGRIVDQEVEAGNIVAENQQSLAHIQAKLAKLNKTGLNKNGDIKPKRVFRLMGRDTIMTPGSTSFQNEMIRAAGGTPPDFGRQGSIVPVTKEEWQNFNPQVIYGCTPDQEAAANFFTRPGWKDVDAVRNQQIYYFPCELTCRASTMIGPFVSWLSSMIYAQEFANPENDVYSPGILSSRPLKIDLDLVASASIIHSPIYDFENKTLVIDFISPQTIISTLEGQRDNIKTIGNHYLPPPTWSPSHYKGIDHIKDSIRKAINREKQDISFLITGADMDNLSVQTQEFKEMKVVALVTAGVMSNAMRMAKDEGAYYEPGTINVIILTNYQLSRRAMTRAIIAGTEAKTAALEDMDIRSSYTPRINEATGTGTDNILVVQGQGPKINNTGGHSKMGELIARAVYKGVKEAVLKQNKVITERNIFQRLKERQISLYKLLNDADCGCQKKKKSDFSVLVEHLLLKPEYAAFMESSLAISDEYEKGLISNLDFFDLWCKQVAEDIAPQKNNKVENEKVEIGTLENIITDESIPVVVRKALNGIMAGARIRLNWNTTGIKKRVVSLSPIITETIYLLGAQDQLIANTTYCNVPAEAMEKEKVGSVIQMNVEKIITLHPDLVIASALSSEKQLGTLKKQSVPIFKAQNPQTFVQMCDTTLEIGQVLGKQENARQIVGLARKQVDEILEQTKDLPRKKVFIQIGMKPLHTANKEMFLNEYIKFGGGINIAENERSGIYSREKVVRENPDIILIATMGTSKKAGETERKRWMSFPSIAAVANNNVHVLDSEIILSPTPITFVHGLKTITSLIHPEVQLCPGTMNLSESKADQDHGIQTDQ